MEELITPKSYQQWMKCFEYLSDRNVSDDFIDSFKDGTCPGFEYVMVPFLERIQKTVNIMLNRCTKNCTKMLNESIEEHDFSNIEALLIRHYLAMQRCRFYLNINFVPERLITELDVRTMSEIKRYWKELTSALERLAEESEDANLYDIVYYLKRLIGRDGCNNGKL